MQKKKSRLVGKIHGQIRIKIAHVGGLGVRFRTAGKEGKGKGGHTSSAGEGRRHSPVVAAWKEGGRASERARGKRGEKREGGLAFVAAPRVGRPTRSPQTQREGQVRFAFFLILLVILLKIL